MAVLPALVGQAGQFASRIAHEATVAPGIALYPFRAASSASQMLAMKFMSPVRSA